MSSLISGLDKRAGRRQRIVAVVLAGGEGSRLQPLTAERSKPAVPFGGRHRIVDFVLSNLVNSDIYSIYILVQYKSQSLIEHIRNAWVLAPILPSQFITVVPPQMRQGPEWFEGTADAVYQNLNLLESNTTDLVAVFGADHVYRMDVRQMVKAHCGTEADVTVAAIPVPLAEASAYGVIELAEDGRIKAFHEKVKEPPPIPGQPGKALASMGNYIFSGPVLIEALHEARRLGEKDFGQHVIPRLVRSHKVYAYDFAENVVPGVRPYEELAYWRDVGTLDAYYDANMDTLGLEPKLNLFNSHWPILSSQYQGPPARMIKAQIESSDISAGTLVHDAVIRNSIIRREVVIEPDVVIEDSIVMDYSVIRRGARLRRTILDRYNTVEAGERVGYDLQHDRNKFQVSESGIVVVPKAPFRADTRRFW